MKLVSKCFVLFHAILLVQCLNLDMQFPIVYSKPMISYPGRNSYFGYSLLLHENWIQIGAPRANSTILGARVMEPGVAYRCRFYEACEEVDLDRNANQPRDNMFVHDLKNHSWIGGAMAMENDPKGKVVVCGHRWKNQANLSPSKSRKYQWDEYTMPGICYISRYYESEFIQKFEYYLPPEAYKRDIKYGKLNYYGLFFKSQMGMSVYIAPPAKDSRTLLIGTPGAGRFWTGGLIERRRTPQAAVEARRKRETRKTDFGPYVSKMFIHELAMEFPARTFDMFGYFGYQVAAGYFFSYDELFHVASAPRDADMRGMVFVYLVDYTNPENPKLQHYDVLQGQSFGEYFGSSLAVADVNGDGLDDLIVGAPLFTLHGDEGCIYVFSKYIWFDSEIQYFFEKPEKKVGFKVGGRFGTALASLGDIDQDGFEDIAVGAPYDDHGVVYIYNGSPKGLSSKHTQQIKASDIHESIRGFGISISRSADIDKNKFTDIAVGSYLSEHVVVLRSHPVIEVHVDLISHVKQFNMSEAKFLVTACLSYNGSENIPDKVEVVRIIDVDIRFHRFKSIPPKPVTLYRKKQDCEKITVQQNEKSGDSYDDLSDITIVLSQNLKKKESNKSQVLWVNDTSFNKDADGFCSYCPVLKRIHTSEISIPYARECGSDGVCRSDAQLICRLTQNNTQINEYVLGTYPTLKLAVNVLNRGHTLYSPKVDIDIPKEVELAHMPSTCEFTKSSILSMKCKFSLIKNGAMDTVNISLDLSSYATLRKLLEEKKNLTISVKISEDNYIDNNTTNNYCNMTLNLIMSADVNITGNPDGDVFFTKNDRKKSIFTHIYKVSNVGISPIKVVQAFFYVPFEWHGSGTSVLFSTTSLQAQLNEKSIVCNPIEINAATKQNINLGAIKSGAEQGKNKIVLSDDHPSNRTFYLNCSSPNVKCKAWQCNFFEFKASTVAKIIITSRLNVSVLVPVMEQRDIIYFSSHGHVEMIVANNNPPPDIKTFHDIMVTSTAIGTVEDEKIRLWIIILCIIAGILLIAAIVIGLAKAGFFKREKKEELKALKQSEN